MKAADVIVDILRRHGVKVVFGYQGGSVTHIVDSLACAQGIEYVQCYNEQGASFAADAYARVADEGIGVALATSGPGATNLITGIADAYCDSVPVLFLTGQVHSYAMKNGKEVRQASFQEVDIVSIVRPITKYAACVTDANDLVSILLTAIAYTKEGRNGPALVDIPVDIQGQDIIYDVEIHEKGFFMKEAANVSEKLLDLTTKLSHLVKKANRPLILAGGGIQQAGVQGELSDFVKRTGIPVVVSLQGLDALPHTNPCYVGFIGAYGNRYANLALQNADLLIVLGSRLDGRQTGKNTDAFAQGAYIVHVDVDENELCHHIDEDLAINCDLRDFFEHAEKQIACQGEPWAEWRNVIGAWRSLYPDTDEYGESSDINPNALLRLLGQELKTKAIVCLDVGQNQLWAAQSLRVVADDIRVLSSGGLGAMGFALPAIVGAYFAQPDAMILGIMGDGGLQMNIQELQLISQLRLPIALVVMDNGCLGLIRDIQEKYYDNRFIGSVEGFSVPDLKGLSAVYGLKYIRLESDEDLDAFSLAEVMRDGVPVLIDVVLGEKTHVYPELIGMDSLDKQSPRKKEGMRCCYS